jgi:uncharacterized protein YicC (UPF0701 family)
MEDIVQAIAAVARTAGEIGMTRDDLGKARDLLQKYGDERDRLFDLMQALLSKSDADSIVDDWKNNCEKGNDLLESLNSDMPKSPSGEGLNGVGARDFYEGEKKVWAENAKGQLALVANVIAKVNAANTGLIQQCNDDLKTIRDSDAEAQSTLNENLDFIKTDLLDVMNTLASKVNDKSLTAWMKEGQAKDYIKKWNDNIVQKTDGNFKAAQQKGALRKQILDKIELLNNAREQLDEKWIDDMYRSGEDGAKSLPSTGETGDYRALDWARFGQSCTEPLAESRDAAKEQAKTVFEELLPAFQEQSTTTFAALTDDPSRLEDWRSDLQDKQESIQETLANEDEVIKDLAEGPYQDAARETFDEFRSTFTDGMKLLSDRTKDAEDQMRV